jgi:hypothetical protein
MRHKTWDVSTEFSLSSRGDSQQTSLTQFRASAYHRSGIEHVGDVTLHHTNYMAGDEKLEA